MTGPSDPVLRLRSSALDWVSVDEEVVALDSEGDVYLGTNVTGAALWRAIAGGATRSELIEILVTGFHAERDIAAHDVDEFLTMLSSRSLLA